MKETQPIGRAQRYGRPKSDPAMLRRIPLRVFLNEAEDVKLVTDAAAAGMNRHDYMRALLWGHRPEAKCRSATDPVLLNELNRIGVNLNTALRDVLAGTRRQHDWEQIRTQLQSVLIDIALGGEKGNVH